MGELIPFPQRVPRKPAVKPLGCCGRSVRPGELYRTERGVPMHIGPCPRETPFDHARAFRVNTAAISGTWATVNGVPVHTGGVIA